MRKTLFAFVLTTCVALLLSSAACAPSSSAQTRVTVDPVPTITVGVGRTTPAQLTVHILPGFHVNSNKPATPELIPTAVTFSVPNDVVIAKVQYPAGQLLSFPFDPKEKLSVYSGDVNVKFTVIAGAKAGVGSYTVHGELKYQACDDHACYPPKKIPVDFTVSVTRGTPHKRG
ncbi:MAG TPA: protein-disulfide reductase DsbD domain-containing protein [Candidatus Angelobacter sp.]|nr:protein-disulfide reductase DsbD domain-containing protein [Candidatus Angelobacter sp.]